MKLAMKMTLDIMNKRKKRYKILMMLSLFLVVFTVFPIKTEAGSAYFYILPSLGSYNRGDKFPLDIMIGVEGISINAAEAIINFSSDKLEVLDIVKSDSIFSLWIKEPQFSNLEGKIYFVGGLPSPGFIGSQGKVFTVLFEAKTSGKVEISFSNEKILANGPEGENIFSVKDEIEPVYYINFPEFEVTIDNEGDPTNPRPLLYLDTKDDDFVINYYEVEIGDNIFKVAEEASFPWQIPALEPGDYLILVRAIEESGGVIENAAKIVIESIGVPEISFCPEKFSSGQDTLYLSGNAIADNSVLVFLKEDGVEVKKWEVNSDSEGSWFLKDEILLKPGVYEISAQSKDQREAVSESSESCFMVVSLSGVMIGPLMVTYKRLVIVVIVLLIILSNWLFYLLYQTVKTRRKIRVETKDLKDKFFKEYNELKKDIETQLESLKKNRGGEELSLDEKEKQKELLKNLDDVERVLREELKDIEKIG